METGSVDVVGSVATVDVAGSVEGLGVWTVKKVI